MYQYLLEDLLRSEIRQEKPTELECKWNQIPEEFGKRGGDIIWIFLSQKKALPSLSDGMVQDLINAALGRQIYRKGGGGGFQRDGGGE